MRERPTVRSTAPQTARPLRMPHWTRAARSSAPGLSITPFKAAGCRAARPVMRGPASVRPTGRTWGEHEGSRGGRNARAGSEGFRVGGRLPLPRGALP
jgi:hypothetical protein